MNYKRLSFKRDKNLIFDFRGYRSLEELFRDIYYNKFTIEGAERLHNEFNTVRGALKKYSPKKSEYIKEKINVKGNIEKIYDGKEIIINAFKNKIFP